MPVKILPRTLKAEVVAPRHVLRYFGKGEAEFADPFNVHQEDDSAGE
jgi:hypothetical protein